MYKHQWVVPLRSMHWHVVLPSNYKDRLTPEAWWVMKKDSAYRECVWVSCITNAPWHPPRLCHNSDDTAGDWSTGIDLKTGRSKIRVSSHLWQGHRHNQQDSFDRALRLWRIWVEGEPAIITETFQSTFLTKPHP